MKSHMTRMYVKQSKYRQSTKTTFKFTIKSIRNFYNLINN